MALAARAGLVRVLPPRPSPTSRPKQLKQGLGGRGGASLAVRAKDSDDFGALLSEKPAAPAPAKRDGWEGFGRGVAGAAEEEKEEEAQSEPASWDVLNQIGVEMSCKPPITNHHGYRIAKVALRCYRAALDLFQKIESTQATNHHGYQFFVKVVLRFYFHNFILGICNVIANQWNSGDCPVMVPQVMEVVGLGFTIWFTSRYLIFKENRDELITRVSSIKKQILGSHDN
ncbi:protein CURVATURE THYLAKOID 1D, chloroplastic-like [Panicum miliaceum]|uniref:Protein CURVATURE THYLAKOID 1D, chloroplastic-like n=1 Tax=Panicum miliaceum TaxID=4540 RepID=A0A3L6TEM3_PANMI|nr:protein CURVATURE THYLAKOID 1D, chloroplastic-like [Panicum miliaceum]